MAGGEEKEMLAVGKKPGKAMSGVHPVVENGRRGGGASLRANTHEGAEVIGAVEDDIIGAPGSAAAVRGIGQHGNGATAGRDLHQLAIGEEAEATAVGRPERMTGPLSALELPCEIAVERTYPEGLRVLRTGHKGDSIALRGEDRHAADVASGIESKLIGRRKFGVEGFCRGAGLAEYPATAARAARARAAAASRASQYLLNLVVVVLESLGCVSLADSAIQRRSMAASWADCRRSAGSLARQARIRRSSMGGWLGPMGRVLFPESRRAR